MHIYRLIFLLILLIFMLFFGDFLFYTPCMDILALNANMDNWVYVHSYRPGECFTVDPSNAFSVIQFIENNGLKLTHIFATHHHSDHTAGILELKRQFPCIVYSPDPKRIPGTDCPVQDEQILILGDWTVRVFFTPGHTTTGVCYYCTHPTETPVLYSGDTLFTCGCGRLLECSAETMHQSLRRLMTLPDETRLYCGHNYTEENLRFALSLEPNNELLHHMLREIQKTTGFVSTTLGWEKQCNPFLCVDQPALRRAAGCDDPVDVFTELRHRKDYF